MTVEEVNDYWLPARRAVSDSTDYIGSYKLAMILGMQHYNANDCYSIELTPVLKSTLEMLAGPHSATIVKVLKARREPASNDPC